MNADFAVVSLFPRIPEPVSFSFPGGSHVLGRSLQCDLVVNDVSVSRRHAAILVDDARITLTDLDIRNGTYFNDLTIRSYPVSQGQEVRLAELRFFGFEQRH